MRTLVTASLLFLSVATACSTDAVGVDTCRSVEEARCKRAPGCGIDLSSPVYAGDDPVEGCIRYYNDACLHGLVATKEPNTKERDACIAAINTGTCDVVKAPELAPACGWLVPAVTTDAGTDAADAGADTAAETTDASDASADTAAD